MIVNFAEVVRVDQPTIRAKLLALGWTPDVATFIADALPENPRVARQIVRKILGASAVASRFPKEKIPDALRIAVFQRDGYQCKKCQSTDDLHADHVVAEANGGETVLENLQTLCRPCNLQKGTT